MSDSVYKIIELVGSSTVSWEDAARNAIKKASASLRDLRIAEVLAQDIHLKDGKIEFYRTKIKLSFKYEA
jgi:flavin-binding protein dodecin